MALLGAPFAAASQTAPMLFAWLDAWVGAPLSCCAGASGVDSSMEVLPAYAVCSKEDAVDRFASTPSTSADIVMASSMSSIEDLGAFPTLLSPRGALSFGTADGEPTPKRDNSRGAPTPKRDNSRGSMTPRYIRTASFQADHLELPELCVPDNEQPLISGHFDAKFSDIEAAMFLEEGSPFTAFLCGELGCFDVCASPFVAEFPGSYCTTIQRSSYRLPLPADVPEVAACLLGLGKSVSSATFTRAVRRPGSIVLQQMSRTDGLLYSERMHVMNIHCIDAAPSGGVAWRTYTRIVWTKPLPWTHAFIVKIIDSRVKSETKINTPHLMRHFKEAVELVAQDH